MATKRTAKPKTAKGPIVRKATYRPGKRATVATKPGFASCVVLIPADIGRTGGMVFDVALRIHSTAGKVSFVPRGKETIVIDSPKSELSAAAVQKLVRQVWDKKGGDPTIVRD